MDNLYKDFVYGLTTRLSKKLGYELIRNNNEGHFLVDQNQVFTLNITEAISKGHVTSIIGELFAEKGYGEKIEVKYAAFKSKQLGKLNDKGRVGIICIQSLEELRSNPELRPIIIYVPPEAITPLKKEK